MSKKGYMTADDALLADFFALAESEKKRIMEAGSINPTLSGQLQKSALCLLWWSIALPNYCRGTGKRAV